MRTATRLFLTSARLFFVDFFAENTPINREKWAGTIPYLIAAPANILPALLGSSAAPMFQGALSIVITFVAVTGLGRLVQAVPIIAISCP
ncbi:MAG: hypothetical protein PVF47_17090 [Anaerolineae bacterium]|jgi:hypothetical protein